MLRLLAHSNRRSLSTLSRSSVSGPLHPPLVHSTLPYYFASQILATHSTRPALSASTECPSITQRSDARWLEWDFAELDENVGALARGLLSLGVRKGERVGVVMGNNSAYAMLQWACASIGAVLVTINPAYRVNELIAALKLSGTAHLFLVPRIRTSSYLTMLSSALPSLRSSSSLPSSPELPTLRNIVVFPDSEMSLEGGKEKEMDWKEEVRSAIDWREMLVRRTDGRERKIHEEIKASLDPNEVINLQFTSGTTGTPKAVSLTHHNLLNNALSIGRCMRLTEADVLCNVPPLFHCFVLGNLAAWTHGAHVVYPAPVFDAGAIVDTLADVDRGGCTALHGVPTHFMGVLEEVERRERAGVKVDVGRLRTGIAAGSPIPIELMKRLIDKLNLVDLTNAYGMTETSPVSFQTVPSDPLHKRVETVGRAQPHVRAKLIDQQGEIVPVGIPGEVCVAGYLLQKGYWEDEAQTSAVMRKDEEGTLWMHTGDEGVIDEEGYLKIVGRIKDIIIRGGENLFPVQIENVLAEHAGIREGAAVAVPDARFGEVVGAWIVRSNSDSGKVLRREEVRRCVATGMNPQNAPAWIWFLGEDGVPDELPKTASGKVMKHILRKWSRELAEKGIGHVGGG